MTNEQAIEILEYYRADANSEEGISMFGEALDLAIKALEQQPCEDCVSREEVMKFLEKEDWADTVEGVLALPPVQPQRKRGKWLWELAPNGWANHICSECEFKENTDIHVKLNWKYCPKCGADMRGDMDETN